MYTLCFDWEGETKFVEYSWDSVVEIVGKSRYVTTIANAFNWIKKLRNNGEETGYLDIIFDDYREYEFPEEDIINIFESVCIDAYNCFDFS